MRPNMLLFSGLRSHRGTCGPLDFTGRTLIAILGDTGAGKTSIFEAILLALYGTCSWNGNEVTSLIAEGQQEMSVVFEFTVDATRFRVSRTYYRSTRPSKHTLEKVGENSTVVIAHTSGETDREIVRLLKLDLKAFKAAVLLPQGDFDRLLHASPTTRTTMLSGVFGIDELARARTRAQHHHKALLGMVHKAELARAALLPDPRARADDAAQLAAAAHGKSAGLSQCLSDLEAGQERAVSAQHTAERLAQVLTELAERQVTDHAAVLEVVRDAQQELDVQEKELLREQAQAEARLGECEQEIARLAETDGLTSDRLNTARAVMDSAGNHTRDLEGEAERIAGEEQRLDTWNTRLMALQQTRDEQRALAELAAGLADTAAGQALALSRATGSLRSAAEAALQCAQSAAQARAAAARAAALHEQQVGALPALADQTGQAQSAHDEAEQARQDLMRDDAAYAAGQNLTGGDDCPVCRRTLEAHYTPPQPTDPKAMAAARRAENASTKALATAQRAHQDAVAEAERTAREHDQHEREAGTLLERLEEKLTALGTQAAVLPAADLPSAAEAISAFTGQASAALRQVARATPGDTASPTLLNEIMTPLDALGQQADEHAADQRAAANTAASEANTADKEHTAQLTALKEATTGLTRDRDRHTAQRTRLLASLAAIPAAVRTWAEEAMPDHSQLQEALDHVARHLRAVRAHEEQRETARHQLLELERSGRLLRDQRTTQVSGPLQKLSGRLQHWHSALKSAGRTAAQEVTLPAPPDAGDPQALQQHAADLAQATTSLHTVLAGEQQVARSHVDGFREMLAARTAAWPRAHGDTSFPVPVDGDLLAHGLLNPLRNQLSAARTAVQQAEAQRETALSQIPHHHTLNAAIEAGTAQLAAWDTLVVHLGDSKFPRVLTQQRTQSLLIEGSRLLQELSSGEFAFTEDFHIAHVPTRTQRTSQTLSGGETFLASLALALALTELHSRSSARLEALFLDEGFGSLDAQSLDTALAVLRSQAKDKLITVISHLRPVAEVVDDVLLVEKSPLGSHARWLTPADQEEILREDIAGLISPA